MSFSTILFTDKGRALQSKALAGASLNFTKIVMGSGNLGGQSQITLSAVIEPKVNLSITSLQHKSNYATVKGVFSNSDISEGFYWREIGVYAQDPDLGEILYCYGNAGALAEYIPSQSSEIIEKVVSVSLIVGNVTSVSATLDESLVYVSKEYLEDVESDLRAKVAGGTGTAINVDMGSVTAFKSGMVVRIIATADNNNEATTLKVNDLQAKPVYKVNTQDAPKIVAGKPYTFILSADLSHFFLEASGGGGGTALADDIVAPKIIISEDGDEVVGTIPDRTKDDYESEETTASSVTPGRLWMKPPKGYFNSEIEGKSYLYADDPNYIADYIADGKEVFGLTGKHKGAQFINFPCSIQEVEPTPETEGHIWVKSGTLASQINKIRILEALNAGEADGTLLFVVGSMMYNAFTFTDSAKKLTSGGVSINALVTKSNGVEPNPSVNWRVNLVSGMGSFYLNKPIVYSKVGGVLDIETSYMWNGSSWTMLSQKGKYLSLNANVYNRTTPTTFTLNTTLPSNPTRFTHNGLYMLAGDIIYKAIGDVWTPVATIPASFVYSNNTYNIHRRIISKDGSTVVASYIRTSGSASYQAIRIYKFTGTELVLVYEQVYEVATAGTQSNLAISYNGAVILHVHPTSSDTNYNTPGIRRFFREPDGSYMMGGVVTPRSSSSFSSAWQPYLVDDGSKFYIGMYYNDSSNGLTTDYVVYSLDPVTKEMKSLRSATSLGTVNTVHGDLIISARANNESPFITVFNITENIAYTVTCDVTSSISGLSSTNKALSNDGKYMYMIANSSLHVFSCDINHTNKTVALSRLTIYNMGSYFTSVVSN